MKPADLKDRWINSMREFLKTKGFKMTAQRELIFRAFFESDRHVTVEELYDRVRQQDPAIGHSTVWRNLKLMCKVGLANEVNLGDGVTRYDRLTAEPHGHMYCVKCKRFFEFDMEVAMKALTGLTKAAGFVAEEYKVDIQGYCRSCQETMEEEMLDEG